MVHERAGQRCRGELERLAQSSLDLDSLRLEAIAQLRTAIGFDLWCSPLVDPDSLIPHRPVVSDALPFGAELPRLLALDQAADEVISRAKLARGPDPVCVLSAAAVVDGHGCWASFELLRGSDDRPGSCSSTRTSGHRGSRRQHPNRPPRVRVRTGGGRWAIIEAARVEGIPNAIAVSVHGATAEDILALVARAHGLSARERELVALVLEGLSTRELAERMFISRYTVQDHLKSVFAKLGVRSRRELVTGMFGQAA